MRNALPPSLAKPAQKEGPGPSSSAGHPALRSTLADLLALERRQQKTERDQLIQSALPNGGKAMRRLKDRAVRKHPSTASEKWHARLNGSPKPMEGKRKAAFEALVRANVMALARSGQIDPKVAAGKMRAAVEDRTLGDGILAEDRQLLLDMLNQFEDPIEHQYERLNLKITPETLPAYTDAHMLEKPTALAAGTFNTVFAAKALDPSGSVADLVFKPLQATEEGVVAKLTGIAQDDPQTAMRNIATVAYAKILGFGVIPDTRLALIDTGRGPLDPDLGLMMERARGKPAHQVGKDILDRADVCAEMIKLQLLDHLTGQGDRHANNYFIHIKPDGMAEVMGIDNDQCFGRNLTGPEDFRRINMHPLLMHLHGTRMPPVIDTEMQRAINALTEDDIRSMLEDKLSEAEIEAAVTRCDDVKAHIRQLQRNGKVIDPARWGDPDVQQLLTRQNSYVGRERERFQ